MPTTTTPTVPVGPSTIVAVLTALAFACGSVAAALEEKTPESLGAAFGALAAVVALITSRTSQTNALTAVAAVPSFDEPTDPDLSSLDPAGDRLAVSEGEDTLDDGGAR